MHSAPAPAPLLPFAVAAGGTAGAVGAGTLGAAGLGGAAFTLADGLLIGGAGAASIPTSVLLLKGAAAAKVAALAKLGLLSSGRNQVRRTNTGRRYTRRNYYQG